MNYTTIREIAKKYQEERYTDYGIKKAVGIRIQESDYGLAIGDTVEHRSYVWDDGNQMDEQLEGVCAIDVNKALELEGYGGYDGNVAVVIESEEWDAGEDFGEIVMREAIVIDIIIEEE